MSAPEEPENYDDRRAAAEVAVIKEWAEELAQLCEGWLAARDRLRAHEAEQREAREHLAATALARRGGRRGA